MENQRVIVLGVIALATLCAAQGSIGFISPPQTKNPGENVTLVCTVTNPDKLSVSWYKDSNILTLDSVSVFRNPRYTISVDKDSYSLHISSLAAEDSGKYSCQINVGPSESLKKETDLQVTRPASISEKSEARIQAAEGQRTTMECQAEGFPKPKVSWRRENDELFPRGLNANAPVLTFPHVKREDRGNYICTATNGIGESVSRIYSLEVSFAPQLSAESPKVGQKVGYVAKLACKVTANPAPAVSWMHKDKVLTNNEHYEISTTGLNNDVTVSTLKLNEVADHHFGDYICKATNPFGNDETILQLIESEVPNELFALMRSSGHRFIGLPLYALIGIITFTMFH